MKNKIYYTTVFLKSNIDCVPHCLGIGHIVNLLAGQANLETVIQVFFAIAWGFIFTMVFYKSKSLIPCIIAHGMVDAFSKFSANNITSEWVYMGATIVVAILYCTYLAKAADKAKTEYLA